MPTIAVIVLNWNDSAATIRCCQSVLRALDCVSDHLKSRRLCIVDNGSEDQDLQQLANWCATQKDEAIQLIASEGNLGFAGGMNLGILGLTSINPDFFFLLNNDTEVDKHAIANLLAFSQENEEAVITGVTVIDQVSGLIQTAGGYRYYPWIGYNKPIMAGVRLDELSPEEQLLPDYVDGAAMWLNGDFIRRIGGLPTDHFLYFEELELNQHLGQNESIAWCQDAIVSHKGGGSGTTARLQEKGTYHASLSAFNYTRRHKPWCLPTVIFARIFGISARAVYRRQPRLVMAVFEAFRDFLRPNKPSSA